MMKPLLIVFFLLSAQAAFGQTNSETLTVCGKKVRYQFLKTAPRKQIKYLIFDNIAIPDTKKSEGERSVSVLLRREEVSDENLKALFSLLSKKYPSPSRLIIYVQTNAKPFLVPVECERWAESGVDETRNSEDYPTVTFYRLNGNEFFRVFYEESDSGKTVVIKGKDPFTP